MSSLLRWGMLLTAMAYCRADVVLSLSPALQSVPIGSQLTVDVEIGGLGSGLSLGTYDINLEFNTAVVSFKAIVLGDQLDLFGLGDISSSTAGVGTLNVFELSLESPSDLDALQAHNFTLMTVTFDTLSPANLSPITLSLNALGDAFGRSIDASVMPAAFSVTGLTPTPEPEAFRMASLGLGVVCLFSMALRIKGARHRSAYAAESK